MPAARESLLEAAQTALAGRPWPAVRMVDVAAAAGVSRQTLYNEFGGKDGLARALVRREAAWFLDGAERALGPPGEDSARLLALADWTVRTARARPLLRALLIGGRDEDLPLPRPEPGAVPRPRREHRLPGPGELLAALRDRAAAALGGDEAVAHRCELAVRLALSYVLAPREEGAGAELRELLALGAPHRGVSATNRTAGGRSPR
ncbi:TetR/AcrR family transcriptional regulator [Streptomyces sp. NPDC097619]|uniref:TetR/AcrR family transcriptional regulator n=1 Tax=Streptomyces sp. NPDC097619 TaxID=3157228 RepID=UPI0033259906